jgi:hypothetical protein
MDEIQDTEKTLSMDDLIAIIGFLYSIHPKGFEDALDISRSHGLTTDTVEELREVLANIRTWYNQKAIEAIAAAGNGDISNGVNILTGDGV